MAIIKVITPSVTDANITPAKLATNAVTTVKITDANVTTAKITDNAITLAKMASGTDGNIISYDASGNPVAVATGSAGSVLTSAGAGAPPTFAAVAANAGTLSFQSFRSSDFTLPATTTTEIIFNAEKHDGSSKYNTSNGRYTPGVAGTYFVTVNVSYDPGANVNNSQNAYLKIRKNGDGGGGEYGQISFSGSDEQQNIGFSTSAVIVLGSSDYISCWWYGTIVGKALSVQSWFSGYRLD